MSARHDCARRRLSQGDVATVDACECGILQVHLGPLTLRLTVDGVASLVGTLRQALVAEDGLSRTPGLIATARGQA